MQRYVLRRLIHAIPILIGVSVIAFSLLHLMPGDPVALLVSNFESGASTEAIRAIEERYGLDEPLPAQFWNFTVNAVQGDLGNSILRGRPVTEMIAQAFPHTMQLASLSLLFGVIIGVLLGVIAAMNHRRWLDSTSMVAAVVGLSMPQFWFGILAILVFAVWIPIFPSSGTSGFRFLILPAIVLGTRAAAAIARLTRSEMLDVLNKQYVVTATAKGMLPRTVVGVHALRNAVIPVITLVGVQMGQLLGGTVIIETIFNRQGLGNLMISSILNKDLPVLQGTILVVATTYLLVNLLVDVSYAWFDPRIRY